ncbi:hypothetical protein NZK33_18215 [Cyanobium sp. FGCU-6]|nr:hypothetical protein [Cyanobium sp. FGCU6]
MESRRLVVWISAGILGFQGGTLALDLINCTVLSWLWVERHGLESIGVPLVPGRRGRASGAPQPATGAEAEGSGPATLGAGDEQRSDSSFSAASKGSGESPVDPMGVFCERPHDRIDAAVGQGLTILAGLALGGSVGAGGRGTQP